MRESLTCTAGPPQYHLSIESFFHLPSKKIWILKCMLSGCIIIWLDGRNPCGRLRPNISRMVINTHQHTAGQRQMAANRKYELRQSLCAKRKSICILLTRLEIQIQSSSKILKTVPLFHGSINGNDFISSLLNHIIALCDEQTLI